MSGTMPYIGSKISLITMSELRYEGILVNVNTVNSTVTLRDVRMFGTENRSGQSFVMPSAEVFDYIVFNGKDIKDLTVCEPTAALPIKEDPAVVSVNVPPSGQPDGSYGSATRQRGMFGMNNNYGQVNPRNMSYGRNDNVDNYNGYMRSSNNANTGRPQYPPRNAPMGQQQQNRGGLNGRMAVNQLRPQGYGMGGRPQGGYNNYNRMSNRSGRGGVVGELHAQPNSSLTTQVAEAFDFQEQNDKFDKCRLPGEASTSERPVPAVKYEKSQFFDNISCETLDRQEGRSSRVDRTEQRKVDQETFGVAAAMTRGPRYFKRGCRRGGPGMNMGSSRGVRRDNY